MSRAIGMIEFKTTATGVTAADAMVKTAEVELIEAETVCPGKYIALIAGDLSAVRAAVDAACAKYEEQLIDSFVLGNPHESIFPAIYGTTHVDKVEALGILETFDVASIITAADVAAKTAIVELIELRIAKGMCGKSYMFLTGEVAAVEAAIEKAKQSIAESGMFLDSSVIAHPDEQICRSVL
ncbi:MAG: BMC domain-containing protein [Lachnospiraceae bacterium]|jgi:microcompartment protein CcmL/EutN|nr:BMC domain-containing protein [Lachnospiraceae bacterium]MDD4525087.1 BMC domain-containing protein [Lachnospiraceae bacterium]NLC75722.1 BMC domain-containing protein [Clostridiales bacterium]